MKTKYSITKKIQEARGFVKPKEPIEVHFSKSNVKLAWDDSFDNLPEFAESNGIEVASGCRMGSCLSCESRLIKGTVHYFLEPFTTG
ncbi:MAG TPA: 2Fe-2S iron-sulfur cluster-binding protein [Chitinophagaceae bacterium]